MTTVAGMDMPKRSAKQCTRLFAPLVLILLVLLLVMPIDGFAAQESPEVAALKQEAQKAFVGGRYAEAAAYYLEIVEKHPESEARRYAVQMLGTLYEDNLVDIKKAIKWDREFMKKYADSRQVPFYREKLEKLTTLEKAKNQEEAFKTYHTIKFANKGDAYLVKNYEALLKEHPDFSLKVEVLREIAYAYDRMNKPKQSYAAFQAISSQNPGQKLSSDDRITSEANHRYGEMTSTWKWVAWAIVAVLWSAVLLMKPWKCLDRASIKTFLIWTGFWVLLAASRMPTFYSMETGGYKFTITDTTIYMLAALNIPVLLWLVLLTRGEFWRTRARALLWTSPLLTLVMTVAVIYLFIAYHPNGAQIVDVFGEKYAYLIGEFQKGCNEMKGRILKIKTGYNPNSSSIGVDMVVFFTAGAAMTVLFNTMAAVLCSANIAKGTQPAKTEEPAVPGEERVCPE